MTTIDICIALNVASAMPLVNLSKIVNTLATNQDLCTECENEGIDYLSLFTIYGERSTRESIK